MYIEMRKTGLEVSYLITWVQRRKGKNTVSPYKQFVCRCCNCLYSTRGKCALKVCCCMDERIHAHTCTFGEMMRYCFSGIGDNIFHFRLHIDIAREAELKSCFLNAGHRKCFYEGFVLMRKPSKYYMAQIFLLSVYDGLGKEAKAAIQRNCVLYLEHMNCFQIKTKKCGIHIYRYCHE